MSSISIRWDRRAIKEARALPKRDRRRVYEAVAELARGPLRGQQMSGEWKGLRRLRVSVYRVIYAFDGRELLVSVIRVGHRRSLYR